jgi:Predicted membrane protein
VAVFEAIKGAIVFVAGLGLAALVHRDVQQLAEQLVHHLHLDPARRYPRIFLDAVAQVSDARLWWLAAGAGGYAAFRFVEAYGLWKERAWAEWLAAISGSIYIPFEIASLTHGVTALRVVTFTSNVLIVALMVAELVRRRAQRMAQSPSAGPSGG